MRDSDLLVTVLTHPKDAHFNRDVADIIYEDAQQSSEPSCYLSNTRDGLAYSGTVCGECCVIVPFPGYTAARCIPSLAFPAIAMLRLSTPGSACIDIAGVEFAVPERFVEYVSQPCTRPFLLLMFDDSLSLHEIHMTDAHERHAEAPGVAAASDEIEPALRKDATARLPAITRVMSLTADRSDLPGSEVGYDDQYFEHDFEYPDSEVDDSEPIPF